MIIPKNGIGSLKIDGVVVPSSGYAAHPANAGYLVVAKRLLGSAAQHTIESDSAFTAMIYGTGLWESYGYIAGTLVNNLNSIGFIHNSYNTTANENTFTCPHSPVQFSIQLAYRATSLQWLLSKVSGLPAAKDTLINNPVPADSQMINGRKYYSYTLDREYRFSDTGTFYIPVTYTCPEIDNCNKTATSTISVTVKGGPVSDFSIAYGGCRNDTAFLTATPSAGNFKIDRYAWLYDDAGIDSAKNSQKIFLPGSHPVTLRVIAEDGCLGDTTRTITSFLPPVAKFGYARNVCIGDSIHFADSSSVDTGSLVKWQWNFGNGVAGIRYSGTDFYHSFPDTGTYRVSLTVISAQGCVSDPFELPVSIHNKPQATLSVTGTPCLDSSFTFEPVVLNNGNTIQSIFWNFGDGQTLSGTDIDASIHAYNKSLKNITVQYSVSGGPGCASDTVSYLIEKINANPVAKFGYSGSFCPKKDIVFTDSSGSNIELWQWDFGNGYTTATPALNHAFNTGGNYNVALIVKDINGCGSLPFNLPVIIYPSPVIDAGPSILKSPGDNVVINATVNNASAYQYEWTPAAFLNAPNVLNPVTNNPSDIIYTIRAYGGPGNCEASDTVSIVIRKELFIPNAFSPNGDGLNDLWNLPTINGNPNAMVTIFNRWGQKIFESRGYRLPWDGTLKGTRQPEGAYYYIIQPNINESKKYPVL